MNILYHICTIGFQVFARQNTQKLPPSFESFAPSTGTHTWRRWKDPAYRRGHQANLCYGCHLEKKSISISHGFVPDGCCSRAAALRAFDAVVSVGGVGSGGGGAVPRQKAGLAERAPRVVGSVQPGVDALRHHGRCRQDESLFPLLHCAVRINYTEVVAYSRCCFRVETTTPPSK